MALAAGARLGFYEIRGPLATGGMGEVYRGFDPRLGREVAVKVLPAVTTSDPERLRRFEREARAAGALNHPNLLRVYDVGSHESEPYLVSELLEGATLRTLIREGGLTSRKAVEHGVQIARGLAAAHERGILHRDLKPENVFVTRDGQVKILDFGLAKLQDDRSPTGSETATLETRSGVVLGTLPYLSPEQVRGLPADARSDVFALGAVVYEMLARRRAFAGETAAEIEAAILRDEPPDLVALDGRVSPVLDRIVRRCLEKRPEDRFDTARDVAFALEAAAVSSATPAAEKPGRARPRRAGWLAGLLGLVAGAALVATFRQPASPPSFTQLTFRRGAILSARFAQDGQTVVYSAAWQGEPAQVFTTRIGSYEDRPLGLEGTVLSVSSRDEVALKLGRFLGTLWAGGKQTGTLARVSLAGGAARELVENVVAADWDREGRELAIVRDGRLEYPIGHELYRGDLFAVRALPGDRFAVLESQEVGQGRWRFGVSLVDRAGHSSQLSPGWMYRWNLSWSQASRELLFVSRREADFGLHAVSLAGRERLVARLPGDFELHDVDARGRLLIEQRFRRGHVAGVPPGESRERDLSWLDYTGVSDLSADGRYLVLGGWSPVLPGTEGTYLRQTDGSPAVRLGDENGVALSPDGRFILALPPGQDYADRLLLLPTGAGERRELRHGGLDFSEGGTWFPDAKRFAVLGGAGRKGEKRLLVWDIESDGPPLQLPLQGELSWPAVSADGRSIAVRAEARGILICPLSGGAAFPLPGGMEHDIPIRWSGDGRWLYVRRADSPGRLEAWIDRIEVATGARQPWRELMPGNPTGVLRIGRGFVTSDGSSYAYPYVSSVGSLYLAEGWR